MKKPAAAALRVHGCFNLFLLFLGYKSSIQLYCSHISFDWSLATFFIIFERSQLLKRWNAGGHGSSRWWFAYGSHWWPGCLGHRSSHSKPVPLPGLCPLAEAPLVAPALVAGAAAVGTQAAAVGAAVGRFIRAYESHDV